MLWVPATEIRSLASARNHCTFLPKFGKDPIRAFSEQDGLFGFPRHLAPSCQRIVEKTVLQPLDQPFSFLGTLRPYQEPVVSDLLKKVKSERDCMLWADTGTGKTVMLLMAAASLGLRTLVVVPKTDILDSWIQKISEFTDIPADRVGHVQASTTRTKDCPISLGMLQTLYKGNRPEPFYNEFGLVIFDELHKMGADKFSAVGGMFSAKYRIGATATPHRQDGMEAVFRAHLSSVTVRLYNHTNPEPKILVYKFPRGSGHIPKWCNTPVKRRASLLSNLSDNLYRARILARLTVKIVNSGRQTAVLCDRKDWLFTFRSLLIGLGMDQDKIGIYIGDTPTHERQRVASECSCILATMKMLELGTDIPTLRAIVFATPLSDVAQPVGRALRYNPELPDPVVLDFVDLAYPEAQRWAQSRLRYYRSRGYEVSNVSLGGI